MAAGGDPLRELTHFLTIQDLQQLRLSEQYDLQQLVAVRLKVGQQAQLFENVYGEVLRLVNNQYGFAAVSIGFEQVAVKPIDQLLDAALFRSGYMEFVTDGFKQFNAADFWIEDVSDDHVLRQLFKEAAAEGRLAGPDLTGQKDETAVTLDPVFQVCKSLAMMLTHVKVEWIRRDRERVLIEAKICRIHRVPCKVNCTFK